MNYIVQECRRLFWKFFYGEISYEELQKELDLLENRQIRLFEKGGDRNVCSSLVEG